MDIASIVGLIAASTATLLMIGPDLDRAFNPQAFAVVFMGGIGLTLIALPLFEVVNLINVYSKVFFVRPPVVTELIERMVGFAETARREGILALDSAVEDNDDVFLAQGIRLAVDGTEPELILDIMKTELQSMEERHQAGQQAIGTMGRNWVVFGGVVALVALVLQGGDGAEWVSRVAQPLLYGLILGGVFCWPAQRKLAAYGAWEVLARRMMIEGVMAIKAGDNPRIVEHKLSVFLAPRLRSTGEGESKPVRSWGRKRGKVEESAWEYEELEVEYEDDEDEEEYEVEDEDDYEVEEDDDIVVEESDPPSESDRREN